MLANPASLRHISYRLRAWGMQLARKLLRKEAALCCGGDCPVAVNL